MGNKKGSHHPKPQQKKGTSGLNIGHINMCSILRKMDQLSFIMNELQVDILGISETKLNSTVNDYELHIDGYDLIRKDGVTDRGGGIAIYIRSNISYTSCPNLQDNNI